MTKRYKIFIVFLFVALMVSACTSPATVTQSTTNKPIFPTPDVPSSSEIESATQRWENSGNDSYYLEVEEKTPADDFQIRLVVKDKQVRAAQILEKTADGWSEPTSYPLDKAQNYTVDALLARLSRDAAGQGAAPLDMQVVFDPNMGLPQVVNAEALPSYSDSDTVKLNREHSYTLVAHIKPLIEETTNPGKEPIFTMTRSNGPEAWCSSLLIYPDASSQHSDDCRQSSLQLQVPDNLMEELTALRAKFDQLDETRGDADQTEHLVISGTGSNAPDPQTVQAAWQLADRLYELLSYPLGAGVIMMFTQNDELLGMDMQQQTIQPATLNHSGQLRGVSVNPDGQTIAFSDDKGLRALDISSGATTSMLAQPADSGYYVPQSWSSQGDLLVTLIPGSDAAAYTHGTINIDDRSLKDLPLPEGVTGYGCDTGMAWSPDGTQVTITGLGYGAPCNLNPGVTVIDLASGEAQKIVARSVLSGDSSGEELPAGARNPRWSPTGDWIAFSLDEDATSQLEFPSRLYVVHPDGRGLAPITANTRGQADYPVWAPNGFLYYGLSGTNTDANGIYRYDVSTGEAVLLIPGEDLQPISISPDGQFLAYSQQNGIHVYVFLTGQDLTQTIEPRDGVPANFVGWLSPPVAQK
jgi:hypothetical protein